MSFTRQLCKKPPPTHKKKSLHLPQLNFQINTLMLATVKVGHISPCNVYASKKPKDCTRSFVTTLQKNLISDDHNLF